MVICFCSRRSNLMRRWQASCSGWGQSDISCHPTSFTTLISGSGRKPFPVRSHGLHPVYAKERALGKSMSRLRETSTSIPQKNGGKTSTRRYFPVGTSKNSFSFTRNRSRWFSRTQLSTSSWTRCPSLGERRQSSAGCTIPAGKYSLACGCLYYCSSERLKQHSQKSTLGDRSAFCSAMAGVSSLMATKSSRAYWERRRLESNLVRPRREPISAFGPKPVLTAAQQSPALHRCAILSVGGADRAHLDSGPPRLRRGDPMKRREFIRLVGGAAPGPWGMMLYQETFVQRHQHRIYVRDHPGAEPAIILMHGFPDNVHLYDRLSRYLSPPRRVVLFDFLGWGRL